jgi:hypothetical protein
MPYTGQRCSLSGTYKLARGCDGDELIKLREGDEFPDYLGLPSEWVLYKPSSVDTGRTVGQQGKDQESFDQWKRVVEQTRDRLAASADRIAEAKSFLAGLRAPHTADKHKETPRRRNAPE